MGPYNDGDVISDDLEMGIYMITGKLKNRHYNQIHYFGISKNIVSSRIINGHHKKPLVNRNRIYWIGEIKSHKTVTREDLERVEHVFIQYLKHGLINEKKTKSLPQNLIILNNWFKKSGDVRKNKKYIGQTIPDVIFWDGEFWQTSYKLGFELD
ncbi:hypothetical protein [Algoriphagus ratkowskyi]|nr:hypothetical protein [Algoriphagus ratkowskyi]TXD76169.1 hypothetical protein ESW18_17200 [Algoriphagus ratkowskyi]